MRWQSLFNTPIRIRPERVRGEARPVAAEEVAAEEVAAEEVAAEEVAATGVFITPQSLMTFPVATAAISFIWKGMGALFPHLDGSLWIPAITSLVFGAFTFYVGVSDPKTKLTKRDLIIGAFVAIINSFYLFASTVGIISAIGSSNTGAGNG
jgi:hypothetical protein